MKVVASQPFRVAFRDVSIGEIVEVPEPAGLALIRQGKARRVKVVEPTHTKRDEAGRFAPVDPEPATEQPKRRGRRRRKPKAD